MTSLVRRLAEFDSRIFGDLVRSVFELALARLRLKSRLSQSLIATRQFKSPSLDDRHAALVDRVAFAIPRVAAHLPWRADCLVQALAAQRWLGRQKIATTLTFGVPRDKSEVFEAHAWLSVGEHIVTGGDVNSYVPLGHVTL